MRLFALLIVDQVSFSFSVADAYFDSAQIPLRNLIDTDKFVGGGQKTDRRGDLFVNLSLP